MSTPGRTFRRIYQTKLWGPGSGYGSQLRVTAGYRRFLTDFILQNAVESVVDYGCGDWSFSRAVDWNGAGYLGLDVVDEIVAGNRAAYGRPGVEFELAPRELSELPPGDLLLAKDVLQHLPNRAVAEFLTRAVPRYRYALITNDIDPLARPGGAENRDIALGGWRPLDIRAAPFHAPATAVYTFRGPRAGPRRRGGTGFGPWTKVVMLLQRNALRAEGAAR